MKIKNSPQKKNIEEKIREVALKKNYVPKVEVHF